MTSQSPCRAVLEEIAAREDADPMELDTLLYDVIDPDALNSLVASARSADSSTGLVVRFGFRGYDVSVDEGGHVSVRERGQDAPADGSRDG